MSARIRRYRDEICFLGKCKAAQRKNIIKAAPSGLIQAIGDIAKTLLYGNLPLTDRQRAVLRKHQTSLKVLATRGQSIKKKRTVLNSQKGGSLLGHIWTAIKSLFS
jgi:hypothetical protein